VRVVDPETGHDVAVGEGGEIWVRGYNVTGGYFADEALTRQVLDDAGWLHTGDRGHLDAAGMLTFEGRIKDMLKVGGENVSPLEVESLLGGLAGVRSSQVVGAPDARLGEVVCAFVELEDGSELTEADVIDFCRSKVASYKIPRYVRFVSEWPMSATKIQKYKLRDQIAAELG
jgi:fatty-acyl-CoA synthase